MEKKLFKMVYKWGRAGVVLIRKHLRRLRNWWNLPPACKKHGRAHLYQHGYHAEWECAKCRDWQSDREDYLIGKPKKECHYCGFDYQDPKYCSVSGRTADKHKWL